VSGLILDDLKKELEALNIGKTELLTAKPKEGTLSEPITVGIVITTALAAVQLVREIIALIDDLREKSVIEKKKEDKEIPEIEIEVDDKKLKLPNTIKNIEEFISFFK
jgi:hypothetical protein